VAKSIWSNHSEEVKEKRSEKLSKSHTEHWDAMSEDERQRRSKMLRKYNDEYWENCNEEDMKVRSDKLSGSLKEYWNNLSEEEKIIKVDTLNAGARKWWDSLTPEEKEAHNDKIRDYYANMSTEDKKSLSDRIKSYWQGLSQEAMDKVSMRASKHFTEYYKNLSDEVRSEISKRVSDHFKNYWSNLTDEERQLISERYSRQAKDQWDSMTPEQYEDWDSKRISGYAKYLDKSPLSRNESAFAELLNVHTILFEAGHYNISKHKDFDDMFPSNPVTGSQRISPYHCWDFLVNGNTLIDIDGSIHDPNQTNYDVTIPNGNKVLMSDYIQFKDSQRPYQTDDMDGYVVLCYDNNLIDDTLVLSFQTGEIITVKQLIVLLQLPYDK